MGSWRESSIRRKLEQTADPRRPLRRGFFKGARPKGRKARLDELLQAQKQFFRFLDRVEDDKGRQDRSFFCRWDKEMLERWRKRYLEVLASCERDGIVEKKDSARVFDRVR